MSATETRGGRGKGKPTSAPTPVELVPASGYRSPEWYEARRLTVSASEIAAVLGLSPYTSPLDLWWQKKTGQDSQPETPDMRRGRRLEALVVEDFEEAHPEFYVAKGATYAHAERAWQTCTPDALAKEQAFVRGEGDHNLLGFNVVGTVEAKTDNDRSAWGEPGTDDIPVHYRCQVLWQMDIMGVTVGYVPMWLGTEYREYVVELDEQARADLDLMRKAARDFLDSIEADHQPPIDAHKATTRRLKQLHPDIDDTEAVVSKTLAARYAGAVKAKRRADERLTLASNQLRAAMSRARVAYDPAGEKVCTRSVYDVAEHVRKASHVDKLIPPRSKEKRTIA